MYDFSTNVILPYTIFLIVAENFEEKNGGNIIKDMWDTFYEFFVDLNKEDVDVNSSKIKDQIMRLSKHVKDTFWEFINGLVVVYSKEPYISDSNIKHYLCEINELEKRNEVDEKVANIIRDLEISINEFKYNGKKDNDYE